MVPVRILEKSGIFFFIVEFQWFFIELSVRPWIIFVISAHLLPYATNAKYRIHSSERCHSDLRIAGFKWLCHLYRHCLPRRPWTNLAINDHLWGPYFSTNLIKRVSSSSVHGFFLKNLFLSRSDSSLGFSIS